MRRPTDSGWIQRYLSTFPAWSNFSLQANQYRDFVFRKMFEKQALNGGDRTNDIVRNVRELKRLDPRWFSIHSGWNMALMLELDRMFLSRTVAAEICMEAKSNESAYRALKDLDRSGELLFKLG